MVCPVATEDVAWTVIVPVRHRSVEKGLRRHERPYDPIGFALPSRTSVHIFSYTSFETDSRCLSMEEASKRLGSFAKPFSRRNLAVLLKSMGIKSIDSIRRDCD